MSGERILYYDKVSKREWPQMLGTSSLALSWRDRTFTPVPRAGDLVVCHRVTGEVEGRLRELANKGTFVLRVSGADRQRTLPDGNFYDRALRVDDPTDERFAVVFARFREAMAREGKPNWDLLEDDPQLVPEHVLACYLCAVAGLPESDIPSEWKNGFEREVAYWAKEASNEKLLTLTWEHRGSVEELHLFLKAMRAIVEYRPKYDSNDAG